jgi:drug/metabolite transporter (DMT)-like permease
MKTLGLGLIVFGILIVVFPKLLTDLIALFFIGAGLVMVSTSYGRKRWVIRQE